MLDLIGVGPAPVTKNVRKTRQSIEVRSQNVFILLKWIFIIAFLQLPRLQETLDVFEKLYSGKLSPPEYSYKEAVDRYVNNECQLERSK